MGHWEQSNEIRGPEVLDTNLTEKDRIVISLCLLSRFVQGQADLLKHAKAEVQENMKQVHDAALTGNLTKQSTSVRRVRSQTRGSPDH